MKTRTMACLVSVLALAGAATAGEKLSGEELKAFYTDRTITGDHHKRGLTKTYYGADGTVHSKSENGTERSGKWWVEGDKRCVRWSHKAKDFCHHLERDSDGRYTLVHGKKGKRLVEIQSVEEGNRL